MKSRDQIMNMSSSELETKLAELKDEMDNLLLQQATHQLTNPLRIRIVRRDIARIKTLINEYKIGIRKSVVEEK